MRAIDADAMKGRVNRIIEVNHLDENAIWFTPDWVKMLIEDAPTIESQRKKGKWIKHIDDLFPAESTLECNVCHHEQPITIDDNYCPNCGARLEGEG